MLPTTRKHSPKHAHACGHLRHSMGALSRTSGPSGSTHMSLIHCHRNTEWAKNRLQHDESCAWTHAITRLCTHNHVDTHGTQWAHFPALLTILGALISSVALCYSNLWILFCCFMLRCLATCDTHIAFFGKKAVFLSQPFFSPLLLARMPACIFVADCR